MKQVLIFIVALTAFFMSVSCYLASQISRIEQAMDELSDEFKSSPNRRVVEGKEEV